MANTSKKFTGLLMLVFLVLSLVSCQQNVPITRVATETPPEKLVTMTVDQLVTETPLTTPSPAFQMATKTSPGELATTTVGQPVVTETPLAGPTPLVEESVATAEQWQRLDTTGGGGQTSIAFHPTNPDIVYVASDNAGLFKTENGGDTWFSVSSNLGAYRLGFVTLDPLNPKVIYVTASTKGEATGEIHRSLNGGLSWQFVSDVMGFQSSFPSQVSIIIPYDPGDASRFDRDGDSLSDVILVGAWTGSADPPVGGIWRSEDEGETFTHLALKDRNITALRAFPGEVNILFVTTYEGEIYRSEDLGASWLNITGNIPLPDLSDLAIHPTDKDVLYVTCRQCQTKEPVWKTTDGGQSWYPASTGLDSKSVGGFPKLLIDRFDPDTLYVTTYEASSAEAGVYQSTDGGNNWRLMPARLVLPDGRPYHWYKFGGKTLAIGQAIDGRLFALDGGGTWRYPDGDLTDDLEVWEPATLGIGNVQVNTIKVDPLDPGVLYQGISDFGPYKSVNRGSSFHRFLGNGWPVTVDNFVWNGPYYSNYKYCRLSCSATCQTPSNTRGIGSGGTTDFAISQQDSNIVYSAFGSGSNKSMQGGVNKSTDGGRTWQPVGFQLEHGFELNPDTCVPYGFRHLAIDLTNDHNLLAAMEIPGTKTGKLYRTTDGGVTWSEVYSTAGYITGLEVSAVDPDLVVFTTGKNVYKSEQGGEIGSWQMITSPEGTTGIRTVALSPHNAQVYVIGTNDQGLYYTADGGSSWTNNLLEDLFAQKLYQGSEQNLNAETATTANPRAYVLKNVNTIVFDPVIPDTFYVAGTRFTRSSFGVAKITHAGQDWERLPLAGLDHRNVFDLTVDSAGEFLYAGTFNGTYRFKLR